MLSSEDKKNNDNLKRVLCINMLNSGKCQYGFKCMYAHSLNEQKIDVGRHKVYTIIKCADDLSHINLIDDEKLYRTMLDLTKLCNMCNKGLCPGGYNCRHGAISLKYRICYEDLIFGNCKRNNCQSVHLTDKKLTPYMKQKNKEKKNYGYTNISDKDRLFNKYSKKNSKIKYDLDSVKGVLLTENFLMSHFGKITNRDYFSSDSEDDEDTEKIIRYLNNDNDNSDEESIFEV